MFGEFKLLVLVHDGETKSYLARHPSFERTVLLHLLPAQDSPERRKILDCLERLSPGGRALLLDRGEQDGQSYLVTQRQLDFRNLLEWLEKMTPPAPPVEPPESAIPKSQPGEFTSLFVAPEPGGAASKAPPLRQPENTPGEFTRMFSPLNPAVAPNPSLEPKPSSRQAQPGPITRAFQAMSETAPPPRPPEAHVPPPRPASQPPGEFTRMFEVPLPPAGEPLDPRPPARKLDPPAKPAFHQAGAFTQMFGQPLPPAAESPAPPTTPPATPPQPPPPTETTKPEPVDEFGHLFGPPPLEAPAEAAPSPPAAAPKQAEIQPKTSASSNLPIILISVLLALAAVVLIVYFALRGSTA